MANPTLNDLRSMLADTTGIETSSLTLDSRFEDIGLESADAASFAAAVQNRYNVPIEASDLAQMKTLGDFYRHVVSKSAS